MKKFLMINIMLAAVQVHAMCPVDTSGENICTLPDYGQKTMPVYENSVGIKTEQNRPESIPDLTPLKVLPKNKNNQFQYDSSCQFGVCLQDLNNNINKN